jgi:VanZ family protein
MQPRLHKLLIPAWLRAWWPAVVWAGVIFTFSTDTFSSDHTATVLSFFVKWLFPHLSPHQFKFIHHLIRKSAHFTEYFIFCILLYRGFRGARRGWRWTWAVSALSVAAGYSIMDEIHQAFVASRGASPYDSLLDSLGAFFAFAVLYFWFRFRRTTMPAVPESAQIPAP